MNNRWIALGLWLTGAGLFAWILFTQDWSELAPALTGVGWGVVVIVAAHLLPMLADTRAWGCLLSAADDRPDFLHLIRMRWLGESVNTLLPAMQVGGDLLRARLLQIAGVPGATAAASVLVNLTLTVVTLLAFILLGIGAVSVDGPASRILPSVAGGVIVGVLAVAGFIVVQRLGIVGHLLARFGRWVSAVEMNRLGSSSENINTAIAKLYDRHVLLWRSAGWSLLAWIAGAGEVWLILQFVGVDAGWREALALESLIQAIRNAAFLIPGALGVQDGGAMLIGPLAGIEPEAALMVSLLKRLRELSLGVPGLVIIYLLVGRHGIALTNEAGR